LIFLLEKENEETPVILILKKRKKSNK